ncbi:MAG TPA: protein phosphatase 2C domain-containing protein [Anaerolineae bacterium]|nr:protein phosphatase 2C domain-containing protein [Anaerolineae bacterium]
MNEQNVVQTMQAAVGAEDFFPHPRPLHAAIVSDLGLVCDRNQDAGLVFQFIKTQGTEPPLPISLLILADGLGGHSHGEEASALAVAVAADLVMRRMCLPLLIEGQSAAAQTPINEILEMSVRQAHEAVVHRLPEGRTTLTMVLVLGAGVYVAHVGDTRAYLGRARAAGVQGQLRLLTRDHSMAARLLEMGQGTAEGMAGQRRVLYKAIGQGPDVEPDLRYSELTPGDYLLLCCDGLWGQVADDEMAHIIASAAGPEEACRQLVARAKELGGDDNITAIVATTGLTHGQVSRAGV